MAFYVDYQIHTKVRKYYKVVTYVTTIKLSSYVYTYMYNYLYNVVELDIYLYE